MMPVPLDDKSHRCTAMKVYSAYQAWCRDNNRGYAKTAREFKDELAAHLGITAKELLIRRKEGMIYREYTLTPETIAAYIRGNPYSTTSEEDFINAMTDEHKEEPNHE